MAQTDTWTDLVGLIQALMGASFGSTELTRIQHLVNRRAHSAYRESDLWENFLVIGEERAVDTSTDTVPYTGAVVDAGATNPYSGPVDSFMRIHQKVPWRNDSTVEYEFTGSSVGARLTCYDPSYGLSAVISAARNASGTVFVRTQSTLVDYYVGGQISVANCDVDVVDINGAHTVTSVAQYGSGYVEVQYVIADTTTATLAIAGDETMKTPVAFCTYKKRLANTYGDGIVSGTTAVIPGEFFEYIATGVHADMLRADQQFGAAQAADGQAQMALQLELEKLDRQHTAQMVGNRIATHGTEQERQSAYR